MASKDMSNHTPGRREPGLRANVLRRAYLAYRPVDVTSRSALPLKDFHQLIDKLETPNCVQVAARREWDPAIVQFKRDIRAFFQEARPGSGVSLDWSKLLFIYPEPKRGHESWQDAQTAEGGRWSKSERTGQVWFLVRLAVELENIDSLNGVDEPEDLVRLLLLKRAPLLKYLDCPPRCAERDPPRPGTSQGATVDACRCSSPLSLTAYSPMSLQLTLLGYRAAAVLEDNARRAADHHRRYPHRPSPHLYSFPDFLDLLRSIRPPLPLKAASGAEEDDEAFDPEEADEFARFIATYQATLESQIGGESEWNKMQAFRFVPGVGQDAVLGCFHLGNLVLTDKLAIEAGEYTVELIVSTVSFLGRAKD